ncbi:TetR/AcrR family transcriptional regulator [Paraburkholderia caribensis]|uniref:Transcriptional regulator, TetR family n=2 Tax=Paraburkholderia TaxID=1822464 RepID=B2JS11_PARP8|nr:MULTISPECIES: TetR/AcrR family transcriptional regulator [Paraburkholderia]ACC73930.1 transcriptional regulator, TetR family [Paraburkholderia phymatum STM815]MCO4878241.1 TetR/AcrR family transcriptional regulator [Paraburkholderia caribensis]PTB28654.1 TetR/AcrR family transcriptional regulator [Paraburkholderia caribensis]QLB66048.1 TetR family transcriptional regulator [Paraburkholderia caribensis]
MKLDRREQLKAKKQAYVQDEIIASAVALFAERGFRAVTIDDIASNLGYTKSVVYYYFESKNEILWQIFNRIYDSYLGMVSAIVEKQLPPEAALKEIIMGHAMMVMERRDWTAIYNREESELDEKQRKVYDQRRREYDGRIKEIYNDGVEKGVFRDVPANIAIAGILGMCNWLYRWYSEKGPIPAADIAGYYVDILTNGFMTEGKAAKSSVGKSTAAKSSAKLSKVAAG